MFFRLFLVFAVIPVIEIYLLIKVGSLIGALSVTDNDEVMLSTSQGQTVRPGCKDIRLCGRNTQGVKLIELDSGDKLQAIASVIGEDKENSATGEEQTKL